MTLTPQFNQVQLLVRHFLSWPRRQFITQVCRRYSTKLRSSGLDGTLSSAVSIRCRAKWASRLPACTKDPWQTISTISSQKKLNEQRAHKSSENSFLNES